MVEPILSVRDLKTQFFGPEGVVRSTRPAWRAYLDTDFHPHHSPAPRSAQWLRDNAAQFSVVGQG